ncbi:hypothetical protein Poli38472_012249 [Pythium oligandrum]|uniref:CAAX prenyl protease n=1 Tax=Pythium oligandrum TaxID=41045 RepID=A0A8K1CRS0_PYTOL|nr:hypothetical protein Poli38472_012249 [Pythium oligandrum]|eukprot:TMW67133.1 hypothetical protein Poli38472_012249 [Pythium oligandrum]
MEKYVWYAAPYFREAGWTPSTSDVPYFALALVFATLVYVWETYLDLRQHQKLKETQFPSKLATAIRSLGEFTANKTKKKEEDEEDEKKEEGEEEPAKKQSLLDATLEKFDKSRAYGLDKSTFGFISGAYSQLESTAFLLLGYLPFVWTISGQALSWLGMDADHEIYRTLMMLTLTTIRETIMGLPFQLYSTFVIEQRHGFNKQTLSLFLMDKLKGLGLFVAIGFPVTAGLIMVIRWGGELFYLYVWAFLLAFSILMVTIYPVLIMPLFNKFTPLEKGELRTRIEALASSLKFPLAKLFVVDGSKRSSHSNAYFFGFFKSKRIVLFDTLLEQATHDEIVAILGHELGHWKLWHTMQGFIIQQVYTFALFYVFGRCMNDAELFASFGFEREAKPVIIGFLLYSSTVWAPVDHLLSFLVTLNTRRNEFQADAFAVDLGHAPALQSGLTKLAIENLSNMNPDHLYSAYHYSHPPLLERLNAITARDKKRQ